MGRRLTWVNLCLSTVVLSAAFALGTSAADGIPLYQHAVGSVIITGERRPIERQAVVPIDRALFTSEFGSADSAIAEKLKSLQEVMRSECMRLTQIDGNLDRLAIDHYVRKKSGVETDPEALQKFYGQYLGVLHELAVANNASVQKLESQSAKKAILSLVGGGPSSQAEVTVSAHGCTRANELVMVISVPTDVSSGPHKLYEVLDYGRFDMSATAFARVQVPGRWIQDGPQGWARVDLDRCQQTTEKEWSCAKPALTYHARCAPDNLDGCPADVEFVSDGYHNNYTLPNGTIVIASRIPRYSLREGGGKPEDLSMPLSGVMLADLPKGSRLAFGDRKVKGRADVGDVRLTPLKTQPLTFADQRFLDAEFDRSQWNFTLERGEPDLLVAHPVDTLSRITGFLLHNTWWCIALASAVLISVALTLLVVSYRRPLTGAIREANARHRPSEHFSRFVALYPGSASRRGANKATASVDPTNVVVDGGSDLISVKVINGKDPAADRDYDKERYMAMLAHFLEEYDIPEADLTAAINQTAPVVTDANNNEHALPLSDSIIDANGMEDPTPGNGHPLDVELQDAHASLEKDQFRLQKLLRKAPGIHGLDPQLIRNVLCDYYACKRGRLSPAMRIFMKQTHLGDKGRVTQRRRKHPQQQQRVASITFPERKAITERGEPTAVQIEEVARDDRRRSASGASQSLVRNFVYSIGSALFERPYTN